MSPENDMATAAVNGGNPGTAAPTEKAATEGRGRSMSQSRESGNTAKSTTESVPAETTKMPTTSADPIHNASSGADDDDEAGTNGRRSLVRKYDYRLMPISFIAFFFFFLDKSNIAFARIQGLEQDLRLTDHQFNTALSIFFVFNVVFNIPGNLALRRVGGGLWLSVLIAAWGVVTVSSGFITDFTGLCVTRAFLGLTESSFLGCLLVYLEPFYTEPELYARVGIFYSSAPLAGAVGGLLASGLGRIRFRGYNGWPWIFFIEGAMTIIVGVVAYFLLPASPDKASFVPEELRAAVRQRVVKPDRLYEPGMIRTLARRDLWTTPDGIDPPTPGRPASPYQVPATTDPAEREAQAARARTRFRLAMMRKAITNPVTLAMSVGAFMSIQTLLSYSLFLPTIIAVMGFERQDISLLSVPPNVLGVIFTLAMSWWRRRSDASTAIPILACCALSIFGYVLLITASASWRGGFRAWMTETQYAGTFFVAAGVNALPPLALTWVTTNASPHYARAVAVGFMLTIGNLASFLASFSYIKTEAPLYLRGHSINLACLVILAILVYLTSRYMKAENKKRLRGDRNYRLDYWRQNGFDDYDEYEAQLGWLHPGFTYKW